MNYENDILARRAVIVAAFRNVAASKRDDHAKKMVKKFGGTFLYAVGFAETAEGNCMAAMEDNVDERLCVLYKWKTIREIRAEHYETLKASLERRPSLWIHSQPDGLFQPMMDSMNYGIAHDTLESAVSMISQAESHVVGVMDEKYRKAN